MKKIEICYADFISIDFDDIFNHPMGAVTLESAISEASNLMDRYNFSKAVICQARTGECLAIITK